MGWFGKQWTDPVDDYRSFVQQFASTGSGGPFTSSRSEHVAIVISQLFLTATKEVLILTNSLNPHIFADKEVVDAAKAFLQRNPQGNIRIISEEPIQSNHPLLHALGHGAQCRIVPAELRKLMTFHFVVTDGQSFRLETDSRKPEAIVQFGNKEMGERMRQTFDTIFMQGIVSSNIAKVPRFSVSSIIIPERSVAEGTLIKSTSIIWMELVRQLGSDWSIAYQLSPKDWEEIVAGAFKRALYDDVILTPGSGDHGRDVIAIKHGVGSVKIIGSVKAYKPGHLVSYDSVRSLLGVLSGERNASKAIIATTSDFPPRIMTDPFIAPFIPTRLELMNGEALRHWLNGLSGSSSTGSP
jgi:restriction system protein